MKEGLVVNQPNSEYLKNLGNVHQLFLELIPSEFILNKQRVLSLEKQQLTIKVNLVMFFRFY